MITLREYTSFFTNKTWDDMDQEMLTLTDQNLWYNGKTISFVKSLWSMSPPMSVPIITNNYFLPQLFGVAASVIFYWLLHVYTFNLILFGIIILIHV